MAPGISRGDRSRLDGRLCRSDRRPSVAGTRGHDPTVPRAPRPGRHPMTGPSELSAPRLRRKRSGRVNPIVTCPEYGSSGSRHRIHFPTAGHLLDGIDPMNQVTQGRAPAPGADFSTAIVGYGAVGKGIHTLFPAAHAYDEPLGIGSRDEVNRSRFAFVGAPTPARADGAADTSIVEEVVSWIESEISILRSTGPRGATDRLRDTSGKAIVFQPECGPAETPDHPFNDLRKVRWAI